MCLCYFLQSRAMMVHVLQLTSVALQMLYVLPLNVCVNQHTTMIVEIISVHKVSSYITSTAF